MTTRSPELFVPAITPFDERGAVDHRRLVAHAHGLLAAGAHGMAPFGTTSEANSLSVGERTAALEALVSGGIDASVLIPGTGCCAVADTVALSSHTHGLGCRGVLMLPPFYYKGVPEDGVFAAFAQVIEAVASPTFRVYLYHIPQMSGVPITLSLIERLLKAYPDTIAGLKDSSGNWDNTRAVIEAFPQIDTYSASESLIPQNAAAGGAGCISASANVNPAGIRRLIEGLGTPQEAALLDQVSAVRKVFEGLPLIPAIKAAVALQRGDPAFARVRPPFAPLAGTFDAAIDTAVRLAGPQVAA
ncbi:dihydrodipicolinate synthase family protein [Tropicimonas sp. IMCC34043]|uniref:dihydrodipicolinate synthase family protein n=1 Tax=Tropicimonas sp. IMCC34043 TaxID=2248760 RepID=UPI000E2358B3|nr:dihydrodipicolinate synthase family protein [Tropicimonas sp. IMCC34043]